MTMIIGNRLAKETSPYLLQHKDNPVHWLPWGEEALRLARELDRPILLSSGYAACHWCHVMAHESFEDPEIARIMNDNFICVKLDREERPDIDKLYMSALQAMGEQGGWPLTMFLTPDGKPFWGGTYFPPEPRYGRPGFKQILKEISRIWREERERVLRSAGALNDALQQALAGQSTGGHQESISPSLPRRVADALIEMFDPEKGGIGGAPKFPQTPVLNMILHAGGRTARHHVFNTLVHIAQGGIYDHVGGGFARYSTDELWLVPHFEKMLYDNAQLIDIMALAWLYTGNELFRRRIEETIAFMERELHIPGAGYAASLDADSEGEEGRFYVWSHDEIRNIVEPDMFDLFARVYDVSRRGNWEGKIILNRRNAIELMDEHTENRLREQLRRLFEARERRVRPARDDKVLASWNGLAISALANAGLVFEREDWMDLAQQRFGEIINTLWHDDELRQSWNQHLSPTPATADGVANMARAALDLYRATAQTDCLDWARRLMQLMMDRYMNESTDAFCFTHESVKDVPLRQVFAEDEATPSWQGVALINLITLEHLTGQPRYADLAERIFSRFSRNIEQQPVAHSTMLHAAWLKHHAPKVILAHGDDSRETFELLHALIKHLRFIPPLAHVMPDMAVSDLPEHLAQAATLHGRPALLACRGTQCAAPAHAPEDVPSMADMLKND